MAEAKELRKACSQALLKPATSYDDLHGLLFQMQRNLKLTFEREAEDVESETDIIDWDPSTTGLATTTTSRTRHSSLSIVQRKEDIRRAFRAMKKAEQVDLCFLVDGTGSMHSWIKDVKDCISQWSLQLHRNYHYLDLQLAFVCYTDYDQPPEIRTRKIDFTRDLAAFQQFVGEIRVMNGVGGDTAEDVLGGLKVALREIKWRPGGTKVLIHFADAPCHGKAFHAESVSDDYQDGDPARLNEWELMNDVKKHEIQYWFGYIRKATTDKMIQVFNKALRSVSGNTMMIEQFDATNKVSLMDAVYRSVCSSISSSLQCFQTKGKTPLRQYIIEKGLPNFDEIEEYQATLTTATTITTAVSTRPSSPETDFGDATPVRFKKARKPFSEGAQRLAYHALDSSTNLKMVIKEFKRRDEKYNTHTHYRELVGVHARAQMYAEQFNGVKPSDSPSLEFIKVSILKLPPDIDGRLRYFTYEPYMEGTYEKFNSNGGYVATSSLFEVIQAFSHYTWVRSGKRMVICDIQGVKTGDRFQLTDPVIHHLDIRREYGGTNLGRKGIKMFFKTHCCNTICKRMRLERFSG